MNFREFELQEVLDVQWGDTKTTKSSYVPSGYMAYSASGPDGFLEKFDYEEDGVVLSAIGANCGVTYFASGRWSCIKNTIRILKRSDEIDLAYFYYMTKAPDFWEVRGSAQPFISQTDIREKTVRIPELSAQRYISSTLQSLDDAMLANAEMSRTLESIAQTLFRSWFVDFDPVRAKMAGKKPVGMDDATGALFPDSMENSELGDIPAGWTVQPFDQIVTILSGGTPKTSEPDYWDGSIPWFSFVDAPSDKDVYFSKTERTITDLGLANSAARLVRPGITIISARGTVGRTVMTSVPSAFNQSCYGVEGMLGDHFTFLSLRNLVGRLRNLAHGGVFDTITRETFHALRVCVPSQPILGVLEETVTPIFERVKGIKKENHTLSEIRDALLPRLISGELRVPEDLVA